MPRSRARIVRHTLFALGILMTIGGLLLDAPSPDSWIGYRLAPRYGPAMAGYKNPHVWTALSREDPGFKELVEFATIEAPPMDKNRIAAFRLGGLGIEAYGTSTFFQLLGPDGREIHSRLVYNPTTALKEYFFDKNIRAARFLLSFVGIVITVATYIVDQVSTQRRERLRAFQ